MKKMKKIISVFHLTATMLVITSIFLLTLLCRTPLKQAAAYVTTGDPVAEISEFEPLWKYLLDPDYSEDNKDTFISVTLTNDTFKEIADSTDVQSWFTNIPDGFSVYLNNNVSNGDNTITFRIEGKTVQGSFEPISITLPAEVLNSQKELITERNDERSWSIPAPLYIDSNKVGTEDTRLGFLSAQSSRILSLIEYSLASLNLNNELCYIYAYDKTTKRISTFSYDRENLEWVAGDIPALDPNVTYHIISEPQLLSEGNDISFCGNNYSFPALTGVPYCVLGLSETGLFSLTKAEENSYTFSMNGDFCSGVSAPIDVHDKYAKLTIEVANGNHYIINDSNRPSIIANDLVIKGRCLSESDHNGPQPYLCIINEYSNDAGVIKASSLTVGQCTLCLTSENHPVPLLSLAKDDNLTILGDGYYVEQSDLESFTSFKYTGISPYNTPYTYNSSSSLRSMLIHCGPFFALESKDLIGFTQQKIEGLVTVTAYNCDLENYMKKENFGFYQDSDEGFIYPLWLYGITQGNGNEFLFNIFSKEPVDAFLCFNIPDDSEYEGRIPFVFGYIPVRIFEPNVAVNVTMQAKGIRYKNLVQNGECTVSLLSDSFREIDANTDVTYWFPSIPKGLKVTTVEAIENDNKTVRLHISGSPEKASSSSICILNIPASDLFNREPYEEGFIGYLTDLWSISPNYDILPEPATEKDSRYDALPEYSDELANNAQLFADLTLTSSDNQSNFYIYGKKNDTYYYLTYNGSWYSSHEIIENNDLQRSYFLSEVFYLVQGTTFECGGLYSFPDEKLHTYLVPESDKITGNLKPHTLSWNGDGWKLTLNGGTIMGGLSALPDSSSVRKFYIEVAEDTCVSNEDQDSYGLNFGDYTLCLLGKKKLTVESNNSAIFCKGFDASKFGGTLILSSENSTLNSLNINDENTSEPHFPASYGYRTDPQSTYQTSDYAYKNEKNNYLEIKSYPSLFGASITVTDSFQLNAVFETEQFRNGSFAECEAYLSIDLMDDNPVKNLPGISASSMLASTYKVENIAQFSAKDLDKEIKLRLCAKDPKTGVVYEGVWKTYSVQNYLENILNNSDYASEEKLLRLCADILNYGAAAHSYFYKEDSSINSASDSLSKATQISTSLPSLESFSSMNMGSTASSYYGTSILLRDKVIFRNYFSSDVQPSFFDGTREIDGQTYYFSDSPGVVPTKFDSVHELNIENDTVSYSVNYYIAKTYEASSSSDALKKLVQMLYYYGLSAKAYIEN